MFSGYCRELYQVNMDLLRGKNDFFLKRCLFLRFNTSYYAITKYILLNCRKVLISAILPISALLHIGIILLKAYRNYTTMHTKYIISESRLSISNVLYYQKINCIITYFLYCLLSFFAYNKLKHQKTQFQAYF